MNTYEPSTAITARIRRRVTPYLARRDLAITLTRPIVSLSFDDCPRSVVEGGLAPMMARGWRSTLYIACGLLGTTNHHGLMMDASDVQAAHKDGHEIGGHTFSHIDAGQVSGAEFIEDINRNQAAFTALGIPAPRTFAYPYGQVTPKLKRAISPRYAGLRGISPGVMRGVADLNQLRSTPLFSGAPLKDALSQIDSLKTSPGWMTLFTHDIQKNPTPWGVTPDDFLRVLDAIDHVGAEVLPLSSAIDVIGSQNEAAA